MLTASAKGKSARGACHQPAFMSSCLAISHTYFVYLVEENCYLGLLFVVGRVVSWARRESSELGRWERCVRVVGWSGKVGPVEE